MDKKGDSRKTNKLDEINNNVITEKNNITRIPVLFVIFTFGFYISSFGIRLEHFLIYPLFVISILIKSRKKTILNRTPDLFSIAFLWSAMLLWFIFVTLIHIGQYKNYTSIFATIDNFLIPVCMIVVLTTILTDYSILDLIETLRRVILTLLIILLINSTLIIIHMIFDISFFFNLFLPLSNNLTESTVWSRSLNMGRYIGIFSTPFESGIVYSLGMFSWIYLFKKQAKNLFSYILLLGLFMGGILSVSKAFILAIPLFLLFYFRHNKIRLVLNGRVLLYVFSLIPLILILQKKIIVQWEGLSYFLRLFNLKSNNFISLFTGGRLGFEETGVKTTLFKVFEEVPLHGFGMANRTTVDMAYLEIMWIGGIIGLVFYIGVLGIVLYSTLKNRKITLESTYLNFLSLYVIFVSLGAPVLTKNKFSTIYWMILTLIFMINSKQRIVSKSKIL
jgi:hypothetical protein